MLFTAAQFADRAGVSRQYLERLENEGKLTADAQTAAGHPMWLEESVERFISVREDKDARPTD